MIRDFFIDKFSFDHASNNAWIKVCIQNENVLSDFTVKSFSHILNVHHRWLCLLTGREPESGWNDVFDPVHWSALSTDNYLQTIHYLQHSDFSGTISYYSEGGEPLEKTAIDVLYHILNHSNYHRAQIAMDLRASGVIPPSFNFISYH